MEEVGKMFGEGKLIVTEVLQSAEVMQSAVSILEPMLPKSSADEKKKVLLATVKGDVHDIGKNLVKIIFSSNGYNVIDIGTKIDSQTLIKSIREHKPDVIGLSGLLVKSAKNMVTTAEDLERSGINLPLILGGAVLSEKFIRRYIQPVYSGDVYYSENAMTGLSILHQIFNNNKSRIEGE
jgi:5-methyltetrahydrofolate--homocysteine methyltransferase